MEKTSEHMKNEQELSKLLHDTREKIFLDFVPKSIAFFNIDYKSFVHYSDSDGPCMKVAYHSNEMNKFIIYLLLNNSTMFLYSYNLLEHCDNEAEIVYPITIENIEKAFMKHMELINEQILNNLNEY